MSKKVSRSRGWCFTHNNPRKWDAKFLDWLYTERTDVQYIISGLEVGKNGTQHIQGYIYFKDAKTFDKVQKILYDGCHIEPQKAKENVKAYCYCMKDNNYIEIGDRPRQGHRTDMEVIKHDIIAGKDDKYLYTNYFSQMCQYGRQLRDSRRYLRKYASTDLIIYDSNTVKDVYGDMGKYKNPLVVQCVAELDPERLQHVYWSRVHDAIYYPQSVGLCQTPLGQEIKCCLYDIDASFSDSECYDSTSD